MQNIYSLEYAAENQDIAMCCTLENQLSNQQLMEHASQCGFVELHQQKICPELSASDQARRKFTRDVSLGLHHIFYLGLTRQSCMVKSYICDNSFVPF